MREIETKTLKSPNTKSPKCYSKFLQLDTWVVGGTVGDGGRVGLAWWKQLGSVTCGDGLVVWLWSDTNMVTLLESLEFPADFPAESGEISAGNTFPADFAED
jgi:hypothetical protein